ncbi:hypothetical protein H8958_005898 [Nasalis larvatus]
MQYCTRAVQSLGLQHKLRLKRMENYRGAFWQVPPEYGAQVDRDCLDWILLGISQSVDHWFPSSEAWESRLDG